MAYDPNLPTGSKPPSALPPDVRANQAEVAAALNAEHVFPGTGVTRGYHSFPNGNEAARDAIASPVDGQIFLRTDTEPKRIDRFNASSGMWEAGTATSDGIALQDNNSWKQSVRAHKDTNITTNGNPGNVDDVVIQNGDLVLLTNQLVPSQNGPWTVVFAGPWTRPGNFDSTANVANGAVFHVLEGTVYQSAVFLLQTPPPITVDTDPLAFIQFFGDPLPADNVTDTTFVSDYNPNPKGSIIFPGTAGKPGLIRNWGFRNVPANGTVDETLDVAFPNNTFGLNVTSRELAQNFDLRVGGDFINNSTIRLFNADAAGGGQDVFYEAWGN